MQIYVLSRSDEFEGKGDPKGAYTSLEAAKRAAEAYVEAERTNILDRASADHIAKHSHLRNVVEGPWTWRDGADWTEYCARGVTWAMEICFLELQGDIESEPETEPVTMPENGLLSLPSLEELLRGTEEG